MTLSRWARDPWGWVLVAILAAALPLLLHQGREQSFFLDELFFITDRSLRRPSSLFVPWFGHWVTLPAIAYRVLLRVFGLRSYVPYQLLSIAGHYAVVAASWAAARRLGTRPWLATVAVVPLVVLGSGRPNILFGFQITLTAALALGLAQLLLAVHGGRWSWRDRLGLACGIAALACSGVAVATAVGVGAAVLVRRGWRAAAAHTVPLAAVYGLWWLLAPEGRPTESNPVVGLAVLRFAWGMATNALRGIGGSGPVAVAVGALVLLGAGAVLAAWRRGGPGPARGRAAVLVGLLATATAFTLVTGVSRAGLFGLTPQEQRYVHVLAALALPIAAAGLEVLARRSTWWAVPGLGLLALGVPSNVRALAEDVPPNALAPFIRSEHLAAADPARVLHVALPVPIDLLQDAAGNPAWEVDVAPDIQLRADVTVAIAQVDRKATTDGCTVVPTASLRTEPGEAIPFVGLVGVTATDGELTSPPVLYYDPNGGHLVPSSSLDVTVSGQRPGDGVLACPRG